MQLDAAQVRAVRILAQGLPTPARPQLAAQVSRSGYQRTLGGADAYLGIRARVPKLRRTDLEALVNEGEFAVVPAVRGCIYLVPRAEAPLCLRIAARLSASRDERDAERAGIRPGELEEIGEAVLAELRDAGALTTAQLRRKLPKGAIRSLGDRGKKVGVSSPLPPTLRQLEFAGQITRMPVDGRLDHEKYEWRPADRARPIRSALPDDPAALHGLLLTGFVARAGVTTLASFCAWSGLTRRDAAAAVPHAEFEPAEAEGLDGGVLCTPELSALLRKADRASSAVALVPFEDNLIHLHGGVSAWVRPDHHDLQVPTWGNVRDGKDSTRLGDARHVRWRSILAAGRICGFWDYDPESQAVVTTIFDPPSKTVQQQIAAITADTEAFLSREVGHGRAFSLDTDAELRRRCASLQRLTTG